MAQIPPPAGETSSEKETLRVEAFSDGVFAIAITLLILEIKVPHGDDGGPLSQALLHQWPSYLAFLSSFLTIGIMWLNHHKLFSLIHRTDQGLLIANGMLLLGVTVVPFPTAVLAEHFAGDDGRVAAMLYSGWFAVISVSFQALWRHASRGRRLLARSVSAEAVARIDRQYRVGPLPYVVCTALAWVHVPASVVLNIALAVWWSLPAAWFGRAEDGAEG